jgi:cytosine/adenosine deaminase-related metal-dependent hydrolase
VRKYQARWVVPMDRPPLRGGVVTVQAGTIVSVQEAGQTSADVDLGDVVILPGLINVHTHLDLTHADICRPRPEAALGSFAEWLEGVVAFRRRQTAEQRHAAVEAGLVACWQAGVTTVGDIVTDPHLWPRLYQSPLRGVAWLELLGLTQSRAEQARHAAQDWLASDSISPGRASGSLAPEVWEASQGRWCRGLSPHAPYSVRHDLFTFAFALAASRRCPLAVHLAESREEAELLHSHRGALRNMLQRLGVWDPAGLAPSWDALVSSAPSQGPPVMWIHANYLPPRPLPGTHTVVFCPRTHTAFGHPPYPLHEWLRCGVRVCLATDGLATNPDLNLLDEARHVHRHYPDVSAEKILAMVTREAAIALGQPGHLGTLTPGKVADLILLPWPKGIPYHTDPCQAVLESSVPVIGVMIDGKWLSGPAG